jgi:murein DD-endopeptidase MepM/ murein hydrolase activator NlpD
VVLTPFRPPASRYGAGHRGVDLAAATGSQVHAAGAGTVAFAGPVAGRGVISIDHPAGIRTTYEPVTTVVHAGDPVIKGQVIGTLESGHLSCAPPSCLHWGARLPDGSYLDPMGLLGTLDVRLFPWDG